MHSTAKMSLLLKTFWRHFEDTRAATDVSGSQKIKQDKTNQKAKRRSICYHRDWQKFNSKNMK